jgi:hypothetical protein
VLITAASADCRTPDHVGVLTDRLPQPVRSSLRHLDARYTEISTTIVKLLSVSRRNVAFRSIDIAFSAIVISTIPKMLDWPVSHLKTAYSRQRVSEALDLEVQTKSVM